MKVKKRKFTSSNKPKAIDLFAGCGGLTTGLKGAGFDVVGAVEIDTKAAIIYKSNHKNTPVWNFSIRDVSAKDVAKYAGLRPGQLDLLAGCPPCQGFSRITTHNGLYSVDDPRNDLINDFLRFVEDLKPKAVLLENVPGLGSTGRYRTFCKRLTELGYKVTWDILDVADYGVPQRRKRLILLASKKKKVNFAAKVSKKRTVEEAIGSLPYPRDSDDPLHSTWKRSKEIESLIKKIPRNGGSRTDLPKSAQLDCHKETDGFRDIYGRMAWEEVSPTITSGCINPSKGRFLHPSQNRAITLREAALLQGFSEKYKFDIEHGKYSIAAMIGNAIPPLFVEKHARALKKVVFDNG